MTVMNVSHRARLAGLSLGVAVLVLTAWAPAQAQSTGSIAGQVTDETGGVLPGVTVEAASPALIEQTRSVVTDTQGNYAIVSLSPGTYTVTFQLPGFGTFVREGLEIATGFTATADAQMTVGGIEETVTVSGISPVIDLRNVRTQNVLDRDTLDQLPTGKTIQGYTALTLGASSTGVAADVGGNKGEAHSSISIHGSRGNDLKLKIDGMGYNSNHGEGGGVMRTFMINQAMTQEVVLQTAGMDAESETGGVQLNAVPKDGGNTFSFYSNLTYTNENFTTSGVPQSAIDRGLPDTAGAKSGLKEVYDYQFGVGGPIQRDRLWFYSGNRWWGAQEYALGNHFNSTPNTHLLTPDLTRPAFTDNPTQDNTVRLTWQAAESQKVTFTFDRQHACYCYSNVTLRNYSPEANGSFEFGPHYLTQGTWTAPVTNRLLLEGGASFGYFPLNTFNPQQTAAGINIIDLRVGRQFGAPRALTGGGGNFKGDGFFLGKELHGLPQGHSSNFQQRFSVSYVTGSHTMKTGIHLKQGIHRQDTWTPNEVNYVFLGGAPLSLSQWISPTTSNNQIRQFAYFAQDQWVIDRATFNLGLRYDFFHGYNPSVQIDPVRFIAPLTTERVANVPRWHDIVPRVGVAYDLFGTGRTAIKASFGKYVMGHASDVVDANNPAKSLSRSTTRTWGDANGNFAPDCNLSNLAANGECGAIDNARFGTSFVTSRWSTDVLEGWGVRDYQWQASVALEHELTPGVGVDIGWFRTSYGNMLVRQNAAVTAADFDPYCVTSPVDPQLPGGGGQQICGWYDINPASFGLQETVITHGKRFGGNQTEVFNGVDIGITARFLDRGLLQGGVSIGKHTSDACFAKDQPNLLASTWLNFGQSATFEAQNENFCRVDPPWSAGTQVKLAGTYPIPGDLFDVSFTFQHLPGAPQNATRTFRNADIAPSLGRDMAAGAGGSARLRIVPVNELFEDRVNQLDLRFTKVLALGEFRVKGMFDIYNLFNDRAVIGSAGVHPVWLRPLLLLGPRVFKFAAQVDF